jgi:tetratricopeptide (TPR) repeat protein
MLGRKAIRITSRLGSEFDSEVTIGDDKYLVQTEDSGEKKPLIITRVYLGGRILLTRKTDYTHVMEASDKAGRVQKLMVKQHHLAINMVKAGQFKETKTTADYLDEAKDLLKSRNKRSALRLLNEALEQYPDDPFLLSYYGCLEAVANKNYSFGIDTCHVAIENLRKKIPFGEEFFYPVFYLNLGRAYLAAGKRKEALEAFQKGVSIDPGDKELLWEIKKLGVRKKPPVPFLPRANPINKYIGKMLHTLKK